MHTNTSLAEEYARVRSMTLDLCSSLAPEDTVVQSMPDVSPTKWHLGHVTWFFERFVLEAFDAAYQRLNDQYDFIFNSYYYSAGQMHARPRRGLLTRPTLADIIAYRTHVDAAMQNLLQHSGDDPALSERVILGLNHEQQHQELLLTDIKHVFAQNPLLPAVSDALQCPDTRAPTAYSFADGSAGIQKIGFSGDGFGFDNETPRHDALLQEHRIGSRLVTNGEFRDFIRAGGYRDSNLWLSDGWSVVNERAWDRPLYWAEDLDAEFTLAGQRDLDPHAPVCHVSYYEADAYARWTGARLPTEFEWETAAAAEDIEGNFVGARIWHPTATRGKQFYGRWCRSTAAVSRSRT